MVNSLLLTPTIFPCCEQCDRLAERECKGTAKMAFFNGSYALSEVKVCIALIMSIKEAPPTDVRAEVRY